MEALPTLLLRTAVNPWAYGNVGRARAVVDRLLCLPKVYLNRLHTVPHEHEVPHTVLWWCGKPLRLQAQMEDTGAIVQAIHLDSFLRTVRYPRYRVHYERDVAATLVERSFVDS